MTKVKDQIAGYTVQRVEALPNISGTFIELTHDKTGARHIHIEAPDDNNVFSVSFRTDPSDDTGVAHILEHVVLSGSEHFPVRDAFTAMRKRSLSTYQNALTSIDATSYPYSTRNEKDYYNLMQLYVGACFVPLIEEEAFMQEGHRLEFERPDDPSSPLMFKGVVFNEMKGAMAASGRHLLSAMLGSLFPDLPYRFNSGGLPEAIPTLSWEGLKAFHRRFYHPTNAHFYTYGDLPLEKTLTEIERLALSRFERGEPLPAIPDQPSINGPLEVQATYPLTKDEDPTEKFEVLLSWKTGKSTDQQLNLAMQVLDDALLGTSAAPLQKALIESGLGKAMSQISGYLGHIAQTAFGAGLRETREGSGAAVADVVIRTLEECSRGLDPDLIDGAIHQFEIQTKEVSNVGGPFGLRLLSRFRGAYLNGGDPLRALQIDRDLQAIDDARSKGRYFESLIDEWMLQNPDRVLIQLAPDQEMDQKAQERERKRLEEIRAGLNGEDVQRIIESSLRLKARQEADEDLSVLPTLELTDVPVRREEIAQAIEESNGAVIAMFPQPTNGLTYVDLYFPFDTLETELKDLLSLLDYVLPQMGAGQDDYVSMSRKIERYTGGISSSSSVREVALSDDFLQTTRISAKVLHRNHDALFDILSSLITDLNVDVDHLADLTGKFKAGLQSQILFRPDIFAAGLAASVMGPVQAMSERMRGISQFLLVKDLAERGKEAAHELNSAFDRIRSRLFTSSRMSVCITSEESQLPDLQKRVEQLIGLLPDTPPPAEAAVPTPQWDGIPARTVPGLVNHNAYLVKVPRIGEPDAPQLMVLSYLLAGNFVRREIREKGGAYGGYCLYDREDGIFSLSSYRDPNVDSTFDVFERAHEFVAREAFDEDALKESILGACRVLDPLESPDMKGRRRFGNQRAGYSEDLLLDFKRAVLNVTLDEVKSASEKHLRRATPSMATLGSAAKLQEAAQSGARKYVIESL